MQRALYADERGRWTWAGDTRLHAPQAGAFKRTHSKRSRSTEGRLVRGALVLRDDVWMENSAAGPN
jgi:hypothetical protein